MEKCLAPSILSADFGVLKEQLELIDDAGAQYVHFDVMDGVFVPSISYGMPVLKSIRKYTDRLFDVHLMIVDPERY
ncbi:MAG: ribulose-phosphate 3-epimerase, partial [Pseudobutyrivibrio sp.]|nr:ribulose-phosphate 3-epimerase [Pseudobutyrivibrio sp.]